MVERDVMVILETDPETGMRHLDGDYHRVPCLVPEGTLKRWEHCRKAWAECQEEMSVIFKAHGGRHYGDPNYAETWDERMGRDSHPDAGEKHG